MKIAPGFVGIDVSKNHLDIFDAECGKAARIANEPDAIAGWIAALSARPDRFILFEATGVYDLKLRSALAPAGLTFARVNPAKARDFARSAGFLAKTDAVDARMLAMMAERLRPRPHVDRSDQRQALSSLTKRRDQLVATRQQERTRRQGEPDPAAIESIQRHIAWLDIEIKGIEARIEMVIALSDELVAQAMLLCSVPGIGPIARNSLLALLPELGSRSPKTLAALVGLAPINNDSGARRGKRTIHGGRKRIRDALYMAAESARKHAPVMIAFFQRLTARGKPYKVAIIAVARKLLTILNAILRNRQPFQA